MIMVKRVSSRNRRKGHVRPGNVKRRVAKENKTIAEMRAVLGRPAAKPATQGGDAAEGG
jgi:hypothetical protein